MTDTLITDDIEVHLVEADGEPNVVITTVPEIHIIESAGEFEVIITTEDAEVQIIEVDGRAEELSVIVTTEEAEASLLTIGEQGPVGATGAQGIQGIKGDTGTWEEEMPYAKKIDFFSDSIIYTARAPVGSLTSANVWQISKTTMASDDDVSIEWASGDANFDKVWDNHTSYIYS